MSNRNHKKRHGVGRERSRLDRAAHARHMLSQAKAKAARSHFLQVSRLYWSGLAADWSEAVRMVSEPRRTWRRWFGSRLSVRS